MLIILVVLTGTALTSSIVVAVAMQAGLVSSERDLWLTVHRTANDIRAITLHSHNLAISLAFDWKLQFSSAWLDTGEAMELCRILVIGPVNFEWFDCNTAPRCNKALSSQTRNMISS